MQEQTSSNSQEANVPKLRFPGFEEEWRDTCLKAIAEYLHIRGQAEKKYFISTENINQDCAGITPYKEQDITEGIAFNNDDLLLANIRPYLKKLWKATFKGICSTDVLAIRAKAVNPNFLYYAMCREAFFNYVMSGAKGSKMPRGDKTHIMYFCLALPSEIEQKKIAEFISCLEKRIAIQQQLVKVLKSYKRGALSRLFPKNGANVPEYRFSGFTSDWEQRKLGEIVDVCSGKDYKHLDEGEIPVYGTGGYMLSVSEALSEKEDAIGIGRKGTIDNPYVLQAPFWTVDTLFYCIPKKGYDLNYVFDIYQNINWKAMDESTGVPSLSKTAINDVDIMVAPKDEQKKIGDYFTKLDHLITLHQRKLDEYKSIKQGLLEKLFI